MQNYWRELTAAELTESQRASKNDWFQCNYCLQRYAWNTSTMRRHLVERCPNVPSDVKQICIAHNSRLKSRRNVRNATLAFTAMRGPRRTAALTFSDDDTDTSADVMSALSVSAGIVRNEPMTGAQVAKFFSSISDELCLSLFVCFSELRTLHTRTYSFCFSHM